MHTRILLFILVGFSVGPVMAQRSLRVATNMTGSSNTGTGRLYYGNRNEPPRAIEFKEQTVTIAYFQANINRYFAIPAEFTFVEVESNTDHLGMRHRFLQQYYKGIPVEGMGYRVHERNGFVTSANGKAVRDIALNTHVILREEQAFHLAVKYLQTKDTTVRDGRKLIVSKNFTFTPESFSVAYQFDIDVSLIERWRISIDASNGHLINKVSLVNTCFEEKEPPLPYGTGTGLTSYYGSKTIRVEKSGNGSRMVGQTENGGIIGTYDFKNVSEISLLWFFEFSEAYDFYSPDNTYNTAYHKPAVSVQWAAERAYEYYFKEHGRNSFDNHGGVITSYVHVGGRWNNAVWNGKLMAFGDGSNNNPLVELDIVSHELTHGVTQYEAGLEYYNESGALNESFSDILGKAVEFYTFGDTATWQIGKHYRHGGLRDMSNPNLKNQPDTYLGDMWYTGFEDNGGVHQNSGVQNFWFYLLCEGGSGVNDHQLSYSINPIGMEAAVNITYRNLTEYLGRHSDYLDARIGSLLAAADLYGKHSAIYQEADKAWDAVGVIDEPIITSLEVYDITATTVKIKGNLLPRGDAVTYHFEYGTTPAFGSSSSIYEYTNTVEGILTGLQSETKYYVRLVVTNENGSSYAVTDFTTISLTPLVKIKQTVDVTETTATLYGEVNPNSLPTSFYFAYGPTPALGLVTPTYPLSDATEFLNVSAPVTGLQPRQTYYYRLIATNDFASATTGTANFFTAVKPVITSYTPATAPIGTEVTITGQNFNAVPEKNIVSFGATRGTVLSSNSTELKVKVPAGASFGPISLLDAESGLSAESVQEFVPTFTGEFNKEDLQLRVGIADIYIFQTLVEDMNGDNKPDIVARYNQGFSVFLNVNQGGDITDASFVRNMVPTEYALGTISLIDFDGNGLKDIVGRYQNGVRIYPNLSVPGFIFFGAPVDVPIDNTGRLVFNDFDLDGHIDIAGISYLSGSSLFKIFRNQNPKGSLSANNFEERYAKVLPYEVYFLTSGDMNNDGMHDLMIGPYRTNFLSILKNNSYQGAFEFEEIIVEDLTRERFVRYISHDLNQDGWKDIIAHSPYLVGNLALLENKGSPGIAVEIPVVALTEIAQSAVQPGDVNGDGKVDLLVGLDNRRFIFFKNKAEAGAHLSNSSFEKFEEYGMPIVNAGSGSVDSRMNINDLNGDGRPEVINAYSYSYGPHDGYQMEIWQNAPPDCPDPSLITIETLRNSATIKLPPNTTLDQFQIEYASASASYWRPVSSTTLNNLITGYAYKLRVRAKCYLLFTGYHYINFKTDCIDVTSFSISSVGVNTVGVTANNLSSFEVQYSPVGKEQWLTLSQYDNQITGLLPGTTYDIRFRGQCYVPGDFKYMQFTTLCPALSTLTITGLFYNKAVVGWTSHYTGNAILEYSADHVNWNLIDETGTMFPLSPGRQYFVRGRLGCTDTNSDFTYISFTTPCPEVSMLSVDAITPFSATINWLDESQTGRYTLTYSVTGGGPVTTVVTNTTSFNVDGLNPGTRYTVAVAPQCVGTDAFTSTAFNTVCYSLFNPSVNTVTHTTAELAWDDNFNALPYAVDYSISGSNVWLTTETASRTIALAELRPGTEYEARVHINCPSETAPYVSMRFETDLYGETLFSPNPTDSKVTIYPSKNLIGNRFSILDNSGRRVAYGALLDYTIDMSDFSAGMYTLKIDGEKPMRIVKH